MAAAGVPLRTLQEWMGHRDITTTLIYADYAPGAHEVELVNGAFEVGGWDADSTRSLGHKFGHKLRPTRANPDQETPANTDEID
jgi:hypothetical protein